MERILLSDFGHFFRMKLPLMLALLCICLICSSQYNYRYINTTRYLGTVRILTDKSIHFKTDSLVMTDDSIRFFDKKTSELQKFTLTEIDHIELKSGTYILPGALIGGALGLTAGLFTVLKDPVDLSNPYPENNFKTFLWGMAVMFYFQRVIFTVSLLTAGGMLVGSLAGWAIPKWDTCYRNNKIIGSLSLDCYPYATCNQMGFTFRLRF
jgi:hypothetical protein